MFKLDSSYSRPRSQDTNVLNIANIQDSKIIETHFYLDSVVWIKMKNIKIGSLVDSGSAVNCISLQTLKRVRPNFQRKLRPCTENFSSADGKQMQPMGTIFLQFEIERATCHSYFYVFENLAQELVLGRPFLKSYKANIDFEAKKLQFDLHASLKQPLVPSKTEQLEPGEICLITAACKSNAEVILPTGLHGQIPTEQRKSGLLIHGVAVTASDNKVPVLVQNTSNMPLKLHKETYIGCFQPMNEHECFKQNGDTHLSSERINKHNTSTHHSNMPSDSSGITSKSAPPCSLQESKVHHVNNTHESETHKFTKPSFKVKQMNCNNEQKETYKSESTTLSTLPESKIPVVPNTTDTETHDFTKPPFTLEQTDCNSEQKEKLRQVLIAHKNAFIGKDGKLGSCNWVQHKIQIKPGAQGVVKMPYRMLPQVRDAIQKQIDELISQGVIEESNDVEWTSPLIAVKKAHKKSQKHLHNPSEAVNYRMVVDMRLLNNSCIYSKVCIPSLASLMDIIAEHKPSWYTTLDLSNGFFQMPIHVDSRKYTGFLFNHKSYRYRSSPQGLNSSPMSFQRLMTTVLREQLGKCAVVYLDDVAIFSNTFEDHLRDVASVLASFEKAGLKLSQKKCLFGRNKCEYLGHELSKHGVTPSDAHVHAIKTFPRPSTVKQVRSFVGVVCFFSQFIPNKGKLLAPLLALTRKQAKWAWTQKCEYSFTELKRVISTKPLLTFADPKKEYFLFTDASCLSIGAAIFQVDDATGKFRPISYSGRSLTKAERLRPILEIEALAVVHAVTTWSMYLSFNKFTIVTDNNSLKFILKNQKDLSPKLTRWCLYLSNYNYEITFLRSAFNAVADGLSRREYDLKRTKADDIIDDYPCLPGIDMIQDSALSSIADLMREPGIDAVVTRSQHAKNLEEEQQINNENALYGEPKQSSIAEEHVQDNNEIHVSHNVVQSLPYTNAIKTQEKPLHSENQYDSSPHQTASTMTKCQQLTPGTQTQNDQVNSKINYDVPIKTQDQKLTTKSENVKETFTEQIPLNTDEMSIKTRDLKQKCKTGKVKATVINQQMPIKTQKHKLESGTEIKSSNVKQNVNQNHPIINHQTPIKLQEQEIKTHQDDHKSYQRQPVIKHKMPDRSQDQDTKTINNEQDVNQYHPIIDHKTAIKSQHKEIIPRNIKYHENANQKRKGINDNTLSQHQQQSLQPSIRTKDNEITDCKTQDAKITPKMHSKKHEQQTEHNTNKQAPTSQTDMQNSKKRKNKTHWRNSNLKPSDKPHREVVYDELNTSDRETLWQDVQMEGFTPHDIRTAQLSDRFCGDLLRYLEQNILPKRARALRKVIMRENDYCIINGILYNIWLAKPYRDTIRLRLVVPKELVKQVITNVHNTGIGTHAGMIKTLSLIRSRYIWPNMVVDVRQHIGSCDLCLQAKASQKLERVPLTLFDYALMPHTRVHVDFVGPLDSTTKYGHRYIVSVVCSSTSHLTAWSCRNILTEPFVREFYARVISVYGTPAVLHTDRGSQFTSHIWKELGKMLKIKLSMTSGFNPRSNGMVEIKNKSIGELLRAMCMQNPRNWDVVLPSVVSAINSSIHTTYGVSPNNAIFGRDLITVLDHATISNQDYQPMHEVLQDILKGQTIAQDIAIKAHKERDAKLRLLHDKHKTSNLLPGQVVFWKKPIYHDPTRKSKLMPKALGPFITTDVHDNTTATIRHLHSGKTIPHRVSISQLKKPSHYRYIANEVGEPIPPAQFAPKQWLFTPASEE